MKKLKRPYFVSAELLPNGTVKLTDDDSEIFYVEMHRGFAGPIVSHRVSRFEMLEADRKRKTLPTEPPSGPPILKVI
jgi:hypothetical protein